MSGWRRWSILGIVLLVPVAIVVTFLARDDGSEGPTSTSTSTTTTDLPELREAALRADVDATGLEVEDVEMLIDGLCGSRDAVDVASDLVALGVTDAEVLRQVVEGVGRGAVTFCPAVPAEAPELLNEVYDAAVAQLEER